MKLMCLRRRALITMTISTASTAAAATLASVALAAGSLTVTTCGAFVFNHAAVTGINTTFYCPPGTNVPPGMSIGAFQNKVRAGQRATWQATAPSGLSIVGASIPTNDMYSIHLNDNQGWGGGFYWAGGGAPTRDGMRSYSVSGLNSPYFGFQIVCGWSTCNGSTHPAQVTVEQISLQAMETQGPWLSAPDGLWQASGWVRGNWPLDFSGDSPNGICSFSATFSGSVLHGPTSPQNGSVWHQCAAPAFAQTVSTGAFGEGGLPLTLVDVDAAGVFGAVSKTVYVDNSSPSVALSGPHDAPTSAGVQYITATAAAGPSGVAGISCAVDGAPAQWHPGASASVPVGGLGVHSLTCSSANNARDASGNPAWSAPAAWTLSIRQPSVSAVSFARAFKVRECRRVSERQWVHGKSVTVRRHGHRVRVKRRGHFRTVNRIRCHRVTHTIRRTERVPFGARTTISGWLGTTQGDALGGQPVRIMTAADNGLGRFRQVAAAITRADGTWRARLPAGPSRLVVAVYDGASSVEPAFSEPAHLVVPASIRLLSIRPRHAPWGGTIMITGLLRGGYLPSAGERVDVRLSYNGGSADIASTHVTGRGRFKLRYRFSSGSGTVDYPIWLTTSADSAYPYAPASSRKKIVVVGP